MKKLLVVFLASGATALAQPPALNFPDGGATAGLLAGALLLLVTVRRLHK